MKYSGFSWLKESISSSVFFYKVWFYSIRRWRGDHVRLPSIKDDFYFDGYPRSGNTFFAVLLGKVYPNKSFASHLHVIAGLKIALHLKLPIFVIIRKPQDAVISNLYRKVIENKTSPDHDLIEMLLRSYYNYYMFVKKHISNINTFKFESCINNELLLVREVSREAGFEKRSDDSLQKILNNFKILMEKKEEQKKSHASSLPNDNRAAFKKEYLNKVLNSPSYGIAENIYNEVIENDLFSEKTS